GFEDALWTSHIVMNTKAHRLVAAFARREHLQFNGLHVIKCIDHRNVNVLSLSGAVTMKERIAKRGKAIDACNAVGNSNSYKARRPVWITGHMHDSRERLCNIIIACEVRKWTFAPER